MRKLPFLQRLFLFVIISTFVTGCAKLLDVDKPGNKITGDQAFQNVDTAVRTVTGIYTEISNAGNMLWGYTTVYSGMYVDELRYNGAGPSMLEFFQASIDPGNETLEKWFWAAPYTFIHHVNKCIEGLHVSHALPPAVQTQLMGECRFLRALLYFHLIQFFGAVPLVTVTDYTITSPLPRAHVDLVWATILEDLRMAKKLLPATYPSAGRVRANKWAAASLLARCYLYKQEWAMAENEATGVINSGSYQLDSLRNVFLSSSREAIFQLLPTMSGYSSMEAFLMVPPGNARPAFELTGQQLALFEPGDRRKDSWTRSRQVGSRTYYYPFKYTKRPDFSGAFEAAEYSTLFRLAEIYLIRAESRLALGTLPNAVADLNKVRARAGLPLLHATDAGMKEEVLRRYIDRERRLELFAENGHRWFDLKRNGQLNSAMSQLKTGWKQDHGLWPIPRAQIILNPALSQNPGYQ